MGITCIARWPSTPRDELQQFLAHIMNLPNVEPRGRLRHLARSYRSTAYPDRFLFTFSYGENTHILLEDRKSLERPAALEKLRAEQQATAQTSNVRPQPVEDDDVIILDGAGEEPSIVAETKHVQLPLHFRSTYISIKPPTTFEKYLGQVKGKWGVRPAIAMLEVLVFVVRTDWIVRIGHLFQGTVHKGLMLEVEYLPLQTYPPTTNGKPPAILAEFVSSIVPQTHSTFVFASSRFSEEQWLDILGSGDTPAQTSRTPPQTTGIYSYGFEHASPSPSDWGSGFVQEQRSSFLLLKMLLEERLLN